MSIEIIKYKGQVGTVTRDSNTGSQRFLPAGHGHYSLSELENIELELVETATERDKLNYIITEFSQGGIIGIHSIGEYQVIEYLSKMNDKVMFTTYLYYARTAHSYYSLDEALIGCITYKQEGANSQACEYICKMIGLYDIEEK